MNFVAWLAGRKWGIGVVGSILLGIVSGGRQEVQPAAPQTGPVVVSELAFVQGQSITMAEVRFLLSQVRPATTGQRAALDQWLSQRSADEAEPVPVTIPEEVVSAAVSQWIERLVVLSFLEREQLAVPRTQVEADLKSWDDRLRELGTSLEAYRLSSGISYESLLRFRQWELSWQSYLDRRITEESLQKYFAQFRPEFDGTRKRVAHVVLVIPAEDPTRAKTREEQDELRRAAQAKLTEIRQRIGDGGLTFSEAAAEYSQGTSAAQGGDLGWILREGPLSEAISKEAFQLAVGEISQPILSPHGVHLVTVLEESPGSIGYEQVIEQVKTSAIQKLWQMILTQETGNLSIEHRR